MASRRFAALVAIGALTCVVAASGVCIPLMAMAFTLNYQVGFCIGLGLLLAICSFAL